MNFLIKSEIGKFVFFNIQNIRNQIEHSHSGSFNLRAFGSGKNGCERGFEVVNDGVGHQFFKFAQLVQIIVLRFQFFGLCRNFVSLRQ